MNPPYLIFLIFFERERLFHSNISVFTVYVSDDNAFSIFSAELQPSIYHLESTGWQALGLFTVKWISISWSFNDIVL